MTSELKPCPFCGSGYIDTGCLTVGCCRCGANGPAGYEGTTEGWNDRPLEDDLRRQLAAANERAGRLETKLASVRRYVEARAGCMTTDAYDKGRDSVCAGVIERLDEEVPDAL